MPCVSVIDRYLREGYVEKLMNLLPLNEASNSYHHPFSRAVPNGFDLSASRWKSHVYCPIRAIDSGLSEPSLQTPDSREINCQTSSVVAGNMCCPIICRIGTWYGVHTFPKQGVRWEMISGGKRALTHSPPAIKALNLELRYPTSLRDLYRPVQLTTVTDGSLTMGYIGLQT
jgi:hypothetical protein